MANPVFVCILLIAPSEAVLADIQRVVAHIGHIAVAAEEPDTAGSLQES